MSVGNAKEHLRGPIWYPATLLPVLECRYADADEHREARLRQAQTLTNCANIGWLVDRPARSTSLASANLSRLTNTFLQLVEC